MNLIEILKAWKNVAFPTEEVEQLAKERLEVCINCPDMEIIDAPDWITNVSGKYICSACHCPLLGKTHSPENSCPKKKWNL